VVVSCSRRQKIVIGLQQWYYLQFNCVKLEIMLRKKGLKNVDGRQVLMLENAYYQCNPPDIQAVHTKVRTPLELYVRHLMYRVLSKSTAGDIVKTFRKIDWNDEASVSMLARHFIKIWKIRYSNLHLIAYILSQLDRYHPDFIMHVIHATLDSLKHGMELNFYKVLFNALMTRKINVESVLQSSLGNCMFIGCLISTRLWLFCIHCASLDILVTLFHGPEWRDTMMPSMISFEFDWSVQL
jgi:hypothetical protein